MPAGEIADAVDATPTAASFHLKELDRASDGDLLRPSPVWFSGQLPHSTAVSHLESTVRAPQERLNASAVPLAISADDRAHAIGVLRCDRSWSETHHSVIVGQAVVSEDAAGLGASRVPLVPQSGPPEAS
jgi:hypothetical protein